MLARALSAGSGEVDLLIRTGGEKRLSDFLLWESAYAELLFTDRPWPDFDASDLDAALGRIQTSGTTLWLCARGHYRYRQCAVTITTKKLAWWLRTFPGSILREIAEMCG
jgi:hypothetical protein